jgi:fructose-1,6-bisphosphatase I
MDASTQGGEHQTLPDVAVPLWGDSGLDAVILAIADGAREVQRHVQLAALGGVLGTTGEVNVQGEIVQRLDAIGSETFVDSLIGSGRVVAVGSEELESAVISDAGGDQGYIVLMDPLDGSSNIDVAVTIGSIFGIWRASPGTPVTETVILQPGSEQVAAAYVVYGSSTVLVAATQQGVQGFTLDAGSSEFRLTHPDMRFPNECEYYSTNDGNFKKWDEGTQRAVADLQDRYSLRYVGSLVADFHRNLLKGGIFLYPGDRTSPEGKLRLMYEANPLGFIAEQAGGAASTGAERILDVKPEKLHQRTPLIVGNRGAVEETVSVASGASLVR